MTEGARLMQKFVADREIKAGDELTINYSGKSGASFSEGDRWFKGRAAVPIFSQPGEPRLRTARFRALRIRVLMI